MEMPVEHEELRADEASRLLALDPLTFAPRILATSANPTPPSFATN